MKPKSDRQRMIDELINSSHRWSAEEDVSWKTHVLLHGTKGFYSMTDEEIIAEYNEIKGEK